MQMANQENITKDTKDKICVICQNVYFGFFLSLSKLKQRDLRECFDVSEILIT